MMTLYHGTSAKNAKKLLSNGWEPGSGSVGPNCGNANYLYLTSFPEDAAWFGKRHGSDFVIIKVSVSLENLVPDPEDSTWETVEEEIQSSLRTGLPAKLALSKPTGPDAFSVFSGALEII